MSSIYIVSHEKVIGVGQLSTQLKKFAKVVKLTVDITANSNRGFNRLYILFLT